jgi:hypothetical protein
MKEADNRINFLDITATKVDHKISFNIYRKPIATDVIILSDSCHPPEQKLVAIRYITNRHLTYLTKETNKRKEHDTLKPILYKNKCDTRFVINTTATNDVQEEKRSKNKNKMGPNSHTLDDKLNLLLFQKLKS